MAFFPFLFCTDKCRLKVISHPTKKIGLQQAKPNNHARYLVIFGGLAVVVIGMTVDPWLCVPGFRRVCLYRMQDGIAVKLWGIAAGF
jgi:hypothetical protein